MAKPMYKKLIAHSEKEALKYGKYLRTSAKAIAQEIAKELKASVKRIAPATLSDSGKLIYVQVKTHETLNQQRLQELTGDLKKYRGFLSLDISADEGKGFTVSYYIISPFGPTHARMTG